MSFLIGKEVILNENKMTDKEKNHTYSRSFKNAKCVVIEQLTDIDILKNYACKELIKDNEPVYVIQNEKGYNAWARESILDLVIQSGASGTVKINKIKYKDPNNNVGWKVVFDDNSMIILYAYNLSDLLNALEYEIFQFDMDDIIEIKRGCDV
jgi:hypothetical protein